MSSALDSEHATRDHWREPPDLAATGDTAGHWLRRHALLLTVLWAMLLCVLAVGLATRQPWLGLQLGVVDGQVQVLAVGHASPAEAAGLRPGAHLLAVSSRRDAAGVVLEPSDLLENPDMLPSYAAWGRFYERQTRLARLWADPQVTLYVRPAAGAPLAAVVLQPAAKRPLRALPAVFWFLLLVLVVSLLAAAWGLVVFRPQPATGLVALGALMLSVLLVCSAIFSGRELALPGGLFHALSVIHHTAALGGLLALAGLPAHFPVRLPKVPRGWLWALLGLFAAWALANARWWLPSPNWASRAMLLSALALVVLQVVRQWRASARHPRLRTIMWALMLPFGLVLAAAIGLHEGVLLLGGTPPVRQAWLYGLLMLVSVGAAIGLRRTRMFDLDDWTMQALLSLGAGIGTLLCYRLLVASAWLDDDLAMLVAVLVFAMTYVPLSSQVWGRSILRRGPPPRELTNRILALGFAPAGERLRHWTHLLARTLQMRTLRKAPPPTELRGLRAPTVIDNGQGLWVPPVADLPGFVLWSRDRGGRLFSRGDRRLVQRLTELVVQTIRARDAYVRGAADERERIADDLHDDLGAKLLSLVHASGRAGQAESVLAREALEEMRLSVRNLKAQPLPVADVAADWRAETVSRLAAAGIRVQWDALLPDGLQLMPVRTGAQLTRVLREAVSNIIRHSGSPHCRVLLQVTASELRLEVEDAGRGMDPLAVARAQGHGLPNIERRVRRLGGTLHFGSGSQGGVLMLVRVPLKEPLRP